MNANELALFQDDLAKEWEYEGIEAKELRESATMLRQQQAEIEVNKYGYELDLNIKIEELKEKDVCLKLLMDKICQQQAEIEALKANAKVLLNAVVQEYGETSNMLNELSESVIALKELLK